MSNTPTPSPAELQRMREKSGSITDNRPLVTFLYRLMRDDLTPGKVEQIMLEAGIDEPVGTPKTVTYTNGWLAQLAQDIAYRLTGWDHPWPVDDAVTEIDVSGGTLSVPGGVSMEEADQLKKIWETPPDHAQG